MSLRRAVAEAESRVQDISQDVSEYRGRVQMLEFDVAQQKSEVAATKSRLEASARDCSQREKESRALQAQLEDSHRLIAELRGEVTRREAESAQHAALLSELQAAERAVVVTTKAFLAANGAVPSNSGVDRRLGARPADTFEDLLASPPPPGLEVTPVVSSSSSSSQRQQVARVDGSRLDFESEGAAALPYRPGGRHFADIQLAVSALQEYVAHYRSRCSGLETAYSATSAHVHDVDGAYKALQVKYADASATIERLSASLASTEHELSITTADAKGLNEECNALRRATESYAQHIRAVKREMQALLQSEDIHRARSAADLFGHDVDGDAALLDQSNRSALSLSQSMNTSVVDLAPLKEDGLIPLTADLRKTVTALCLSMEKMSVELSNKRHELNRTEHSYLDRSAAWENEKAALQSRLALLTDSVQGERAEFAECQGHLEQVYAELEEKRAQLDDLTAAWSELEGRHKQTSSELQEARGSHQRAERSLEETAAELQKERKAGKELTDLFEKTQLELMSARQRATALALIVEEKSSEADRLMSATQTSLEVQRALESELDRTRRDLDQSTHRTASSAHSLEASAAETKASYEAERLLAALGATVDHMQMAAPAQAMTVRDLDSSFASTTAAQGVNASFVASNLPLVVRVDSAVKKLTEMRAWVREEKRQQRQLNSTVADLQRELDQLKASSAERVKGLSDALEASQGREKAARDLHEQAAERDALFARLQTELKRLQQEFLSLQASKEADEDAYARQSSQLAQRDAEVVRLQREVQSYSSAAQDLKERCITADSRVSALTAEVKEKEEQCATARSVAASLRETISRLEATADRYKQEVELLQQRLVSSVTPSVASPEGGKYESMDAALSRAAEAHAEYYKFAEQRHSTALHEAEELRRRIQVLEGRLDAQKRAGDGAAEEISVLRRELHKAQSRLTIENSSYEESRAKTESLRTSEHDWKLQLDTAASLLESVEER